MVVKINLLQKVIYTTVKKSIMMFDSFCLSEFHNGSGTKK